MAAGAFDDARAFRDFLDAKLSDVGVGLSLQEALGLWEYETLADEDRSESARAIQEALDDMHAGDVGTPAEDFVQELRRRHGLSDLP